jgi:hypothetical protein
VIGSLNMVMDLRVACAIRRAEWGKTGTSRNVIIQRIKE